MHFFSTLRCFPLILVFMYLKEMLAQLILVWRGHISSLNQILVKKTQLSDKDPAFHPPSPKSNYSWMTSFRYMLMWWTHSFSSSPPPPPHCGFQSFSPGKLCLWQNCEADRKHRVRSNFLRLCLQKINKKLILLSKCCWSALELHWFPAITHLRLLFPSLVLIEISLPSWD